MKETRHGERGVLVQFVGSCQMVDVPANGFDVTKRGILTRENLLFVRHLYRRWSWRGWHGVHRVQMCDQIPELSRGRTFFLSHT